MVQHIVVMLLILATIVPLLGKSSSLGRTVHVGIYENEPKIFLDSAGKPAGIFPEILAAVALREQWDIIYHKGTWDQCLAMLEQGSIDIMPDVAYSTKRDSIFDFPSEEVLISWSAIYAARGTTVQSMADLNGKRIAVVKGSIQQTYLQELLQGFGFVPSFVEVPSFAEAYSVVADGKADLLATNHLSGDYFHTRYGLRKTAIVFNPANLHFAVAQGKNGDLIGVIESAVNSMKGTANSAYYTALERWTFVETPNAIPQQVQLLFAIIAALLALSVLFILTLRWQIRRAVNRLKMSEQQLQGISNNLVNGCVYQVSSGGDGSKRKFLYLSAGVEQVFGVTAEDVYKNAMVLYGSLHPDDLPLIQERETESLETMSLFHCEVRFIRPDGDERWIYLSSTPHRTPVGDILWDGLALDVTERHLAQEALIESERFSRSLFNESPIGLALCKMDGALIDVNPAYCKIVGYTSHELKSLTYWELTPPEYESHERAQLDSLKRTGRYGPYEKEYLHKDGHRVPVSLIGLVIELDGERCIWSSVEDCTERKFVEKEREQLREQLFHSQKMDAIGKLVGGIAHDFNNTLGSVVGAAELITTGTVEGPEVMEYAQMIVNASKRSGELTRKLLTFTRQIPHRRVPMELGSIVNDTAMLLERTAGKSVVVGTAISADSVIICGDEAMVQHAILNIGINGIHAMSDGEKLDISLAKISLDQEFCNDSSFAIEPGSYAKVTICDTGCGMSSGTLDRMYDPFFTTKPFGKGNGLGLSAVYGTVLEHGGAISVQSELGMGTQFDLYFPIVHHKSEPKVESKVVQGSGTVLLVDDDPNIVKSVGGLIESLGYTCVCFQRGAEVVAHLSKGGAVDLVLLDMIMPELSGRETLEEIRKFDQTTPVVICTGYSGEGVDETFAGLGVVGFLSKPFSRVELAELVALYKKN